MSLRSEAVKKWRTNTKNLALKAFKTKCCICEYSKCSSALHFHHINPAEKTFALSEMLSNPKEWGTIVLELKKCVLVCSNCHAEIHENLIKIPDNVDRFDENLIKDQISNNNLFDNCPMCTNQKKITQTSCSVKCARKMSNVVDWDKIDLKTLIVNYSYVEIGEMFGCSDSAVIKQLKKRDLYKRKFVRN